MTELIEKDWTQRSYKAAWIYRSAKFFAFTPLESMGGQWFARHGWCAHGPREGATAQWIGENMRRALETGEYHRYTRREELEILESASLIRAKTFWGEVAETYGFKTWEDAYNRNECVYVSWKYLKTRDIMLEATKRVGVGHYSAWPSDKNEGRVIMLPLSEPDTVLGEAALDAFSRCEGPRRPKPKTD